MRILVASAFRASSQVANAINTVKMAQGFARLGHEVTIVCRQSRRGQVSIDNLNHSYGLTETLRWVQLPGSIIVDQNWFFALLTGRFAWQMQPDLVYARNYLSPWLTSKLGIYTVAESHAYIGYKTVPFGIFLKGTQHQAFRLLVTISQHLADHFHTRGVPRGKLIVLADAVDLLLFQCPPDLPPSPFVNNDGPNVVYSGHLYDYKGIPTVLETAALLPQISFHFVGGWPEDIERQQKRAQKLGLSNVTFYGLQPHSTVPPFLWHADVLLLPPSRHHPSAAWTSPLKLGEYLGSGTPVVATDIPALRDWVTDKEVEFVSPDNAKALALGIQRVLSDKSRSQELQIYGLQKAQSMSYERRAELILQQCRLLT